MNRLSDPLGTHNDTIRVRDIIERIQELESEHETDEGDPIPPADWADAEAFDEWKTWRDLVEEIEQNTQHDIDEVTLIRSNYFRDHVKEEYLEIGPELHEYNPKTYGYDLVSRGELFSRDPFNFIDWNAVAEHHERHFYVSVTIDDTRYLHES